MEIYATTQSLPSSPLALECLDCGATFLINLELITSEHCPGCGRHLDDHAIPDQLQAVEL